MALIAFVNVEELPQKQVSEELQKRDQSEALAVGSMRLLMFCSRFGLQKVLVP